ncbi:MAG: DUF5716 family protein, partial [Acetivibrio sp.]
IGFDLGNQYSQISCFHPVTGVIETIGGTTGENYHFIPTTLGVTETKREWLFGEDACMMAEHEDGILIDNILEQIKRKESFVIYDSVFDGSVILEKYFRKTLLLLQKYYGDNRIHKIVVTLEEMNLFLVEMIYKALEHMGIEKNRAFVQEHSQSYLYYALNQKRELWSQDVALFDYSKKGMMYYQIHINRKVRPMLIGLEKREGTKEITYEMLEHREYETLTEHFLGFAGKILNKQSISTLYFVGEGFLSNWSDRVLQELCRGKRGFRGPNIYTHGACYSARYMNTEEFKEKFTLLGEGILEKSISLCLYRDGKVQKTEVISTGTYWKEAESKICLIFDEEDELQLNIFDPMKKVETVRVITLEDMPKRGKRMERFEVSFHFEDIRTCIVTIKDKGFGDYAPSTNRIWEKRLEI